MQIDFLLSWMFTIIITTLVLFMLIILSQKTCNREQEINERMYLGYGISSFGVAWLLVAGIYSDLIGITITTVGVIIVILSSGILETSSESDLMSNDSDMEE